MSTFEIVLAIILLVGLIAWAIATGIALAMGDEKALDFLEKAALITVSSMGVIQLIAWAILR